MGRRRHLAQQFARMRAMATAGALAIGAGLFVYAASSTDAFAQSAISGRNCFRDYAPRDLAYLEGNAGAARATAEACTAQAQTPRRGLPNAYYIAGKAERALAGQSEPPNADNLNRAVQYLRLVVTLQQTGNAVRADVLQDAQLELARAYRLLRRFDEARAQLDAIGGTANLHVVSYERAMITLGEAAGAEGDKLYNARLSAFRQLRSLTAADPRDENIDQFAVQRGLRKLLELSIELGDTVLAQTPTRPSTQEAIRMFEDATEAVRALRARGVDVGAREDVIQSKLGLLYLRLAGLEGTGGTADSACARGASSYQLDLAESAFRRAIVAGGAQGASVDADWGLGCVAMARAYALVEREEDAPAPVRTAFQGAASSFERAVATLTRVSNAPRSGPRSRYFLSLARAYAELEPLDASNNYLAKALSNFQLALGELPSTASDERAAVQLEIAKAQLKSSNVALALRSLDEAVGAQNGRRDTKDDMHPNAEAYLMRGELLFDQTRPPDIANARANLEAAARSDGTFQARAYYSLSRLEDSVGRGAAAVANADAAFRINRDNETYRLQACVTRLKFGLTQNDGRFFCTANNNAQNYAEALVYEGLYWLREAYRKRDATARSGDWAQALRVFEQGIQITGTAGERTSVGRLHAYGRRFVLQCADLGAANSLPPGDAASNTERQYFFGYGLQNCWR